MNTVDIELVTKFILGFFGFALTLTQIKQVFESYKLKQELKTDLEILEMTKKDNTLFNSEIEKIIKKRLEITYRTKNENFTKFLWGIGIFVGFGYWTINLLFQNENGFNGWSILTLLISLIGFGSSFEILRGEDTEKDKEIEKPFIIFGIREKFNFIVSVYILIFTTFLTPILVLKMNGFSFWQFLSAIFWVGSILKIISVIKRQ